MSEKQATPIVARHPFIVVPFLFYFLTAARTIGMSDTAILIFDIQDLRLSTAVNSHNLTVLFGRLFSYLPVGSPAFRGNLMSVFFGGLAVTLFYFLLYGCLGSRLVAALVAAILMVSHSMWWHSTIVESYALNACLLVAALQLLAWYQRDRGERYLLWLIALSGVSIVQHAQLGVIGLAAVVVAASHVVHLYRQPQGAARVVKFFWRAGLVSAVSLVPYGLVLAHDTWSAGSLNAAMSAAGGGDFKSLMFQWNSGIGVVDTLLLTILQFPSPFLLLVGVGGMLFVQRWQRSAGAVAVLTMFLTNTIFFTLFNTWDRFAFLLVSFVIIAFWGAFAVDAVILWARERPRLWVTAAIVLGIAVSIAAPPYVYAHMTGWRGRPDSVWAMRFNSAAPPNTIDPVRYNANPNKRHYRDIEEFASLLFERLPANAVFITDDSYYYTLQYSLFLEGRRPDLAVNYVNLWGFSGWGLSPDEMTALLAYAEDAGLPVFFPSLRSPFDQLTGAEGTSYAFERFPLDERRWLYRFRTTGESPPAGDAPRTPFVPTSRGVVLGRGFGGPGSAPAPRVKDGDTLFVRFNFEQSNHSFPVTYRWIAPDGQTRFSSPVFVVQGSSGTAGWVYDRSGVLTRGPWRVEVWVGATKVDSTQFEVL